MSSDSLGGVAAALWFVSGLAGFLAAGIGIFGWKEARKESRAREEQIAVLKGETARANESAAKANERAAELTQEALLLRRTIGDRFITRDEMQEFARVTAEFPKTWEIKVVNDVWQNGEARWFAIHLTEMLKRAGFNARLLPPSEWEPFKEKVITPPVRGITCEYGHELSTEETSQLWEFLNLFRVVKMEMFIPSRKTRYPEVTPDNGLLFIVGKKPEDTLKAGLPPAP